MIAGGRSNSRAAVLGPPSEQLGRRTLNVGYAQLSLDEPSSELTGSNIRKKPRASGRSQRRLKMLAPAAASC